MSRRKRKPVRYKYKRLVESESEDEDFVPVSKKNSKTVPSALPSVQERDKKGSPESKRSLKDTLDTSLVIENNSLLTSGGEAEHSNTEEEEEKKEEEKKITSNDNNDLDNDNKDDVIICNSLNGEAPDYKEEKVSSQLSNTKENIQPVIKSGPVIAPPPKPPHWVPPGPASKGCVLPRPSYTTQGPPIRVGLSRKAAIKPLHTNVTIKK